MNENLKNQITSLGVGILAIVLVFSTFSIINHISKDKEENLEFFPIVNKEEIEDLKNKNLQILNSLISKKAISLYENGLITPSSLIESCKDGSKIPSDCSREIANVTKSVSVSGKINKAYLYIKSGVSRESSQMGPLTQFDSIWFYVDSSNTGGHLLRSAALVNRQTEDGLTELVFDLSQIPFIGLPYSENKKPEIKNLVDVLNSEENHITGAFVSSLGVGKLYEVKIFYDGGKIEIK